MRTDAPRRVPGLDQLVERSLAIIQDGQSPSGSYVASPTFPTYGYSWFRDGAFIADAMSRHGRVDSAERFHRWCAGVVEARREQVRDLVARAGRPDRPGPEEHLRTRYTLDGREADGFWENFQLDGYGTWLWALRAHVDRTPGAAPVSAATAELVVEYLAGYWDEPSYDWWEEHLEQRHVATLGSIWAGLDAMGTWSHLTPRARSIAADAAAAVRHRIQAEGTVAGSLVKWLGSDAVDGSLLACLTPFRFHPPDHPVSRMTVARIEAELAPAGVHRYRDDVYYGGGQWVLLTAFLAWHHLRAGDPGRAESLLGWVVAQADASGHLPEQVAAGLLHPQHLTHWEERWGPSATPLLWSHAMLLDVVADLDGWMGSDQA